MITKRLTKSGLSSLMVLCAVGLAVAACAGTGAGGGADSADSVVGTWGEPVKDQPHLILASDGTVKGTDGCNGISTTYAVDGTTVTFDRFISTLKACEGVDTWLSKVRSAEVAGDEMIISDSNGDTIGTLVRTED